MSCIRNKGRAAAVLHEARRRSLPEKKYQRNINENSLQKIQDKKTKKKLNLQLTLENDPNVYDKNWIGDEISENRNECIRFWFQNCNGLVKKKMI